MYVFWNRLFCGAFFSWFCWTLTEPNCWYHLLLFIIAVTAVLVIGTHSQQDNGFGTEDVDHFVSSAAEFSYCRLNHLKHDLQNSPFQTSYSLQLVCSSGVNFSSQFSILVCFGNSFGKKKNFLKFYIRKLIKIKCKTMAVLLSVSRFFVLFLCVRFSVWIMQWIGKSDIRKKKSNHLVLICYIADSPHAIRVTTTTWTNTLSSILFWFFIFFFSALISWTWKKMKQNKTSESFFFWVLITI